MGSPRNIRSAYQANAVATAGPAQLLLMLLDRLVLDAERGQTALASGDREQANLQLQHAQAIVTELQVTLVVEGMPAGRELLALYDYLQRRLIQANIGRDAAAAAEAVTLTRELRETWRLAAVQAATTAAASA